MEELGWRSGAECQNGSAPELQHLRQQIDLIDEQVAMLLKRRLLVGETVGKLKARTGMQVKDESREKRVLAKVRETIGDGPIADAACRVYRTLLDESCKLQQIEEKPGRLSSGPLYFDQVAIIGMGLIGGALARQIKKRLPATQIIGCDKPEIVARALAAGLIDSAEIHASAAASRAGLILLCAPPSSNIAVLQQIARVTVSNQVILDTTSSKGAICDQAQALRMEADFIGGHPFFGSEKSGLEASANVEVDGKQFCIVPTACSSELTVKRVEKWIAEIGMAVTVRGAQAHDEAVGSTSHVVQLMAVALGCLLSAGRTDAELKETLQLSGPSLRSHTRLMSSPALMWKEIIATNRPAVLRALRRLIHELTSLEKAIETDDMDAVTDRFTKAARVAACLPPG